jgi:hypothetical protein
MYFNVVDTALLDSNMVFVLIGKMRELSRVYYYNNNGIENEK